MCMVCFNVGIGFKYKKSSIVWAPHITEMSTIKNKVYNSRTNPKNILALKYI